MSRDRHRCTCFRPTPSPDLTLSNVTDPGRHPSRLNAATTCHLLCDTPTRDALLYSFAPGLDDFFIGGSLSTSGTAEQRSVLTFRRVRHSHGALLFHRRVKPKAAQRPSAMTFACFWAVSSFIQSRHAWARLSLMHCLSHKSSFFATERRK